MGRNPSQYKKRNVNLASETRAAGDEEEGGKAPKRRHEYQNCPQVVLTIQLGQMNITVAKGTISAPIWSTPRAPLYQSHIYTM